MRAGSSIPRAFGPSLAAVLLFASALLGASGQRTAAAEADTLDVVLSAQERLTSGSIPHAPIEIIGDSQFTPANGVVSGRGTPIDPFLIAGWDISAPPGESAVRISLTTLAVELRDCRLVSEGAPALDIRGSENLQMVGLDITGDAPMVSISGSDSISFRDSTLTSPSSGSVFELRSTSNVTVDRNSFQAVGLAVHGGNGVLLTRNHFSGASRAIELGNGSAAVVHNLLEGAGVGVSLQSGAHRIESNVFERGQTSIAGLGGAGSLILGNTFDRTQGSAVLLRAEIASVEVVGNDFLGPRGAAPWAQDSSLGSRFSTATGGNHWSDWTTPDSDGNGIVDTPRSITGSANSSDLFPRVSSFGNWNPSPPQAPSMMGIEEIDLNGTPAVSLRWDLPDSDLPLMQYVVMRGRNASSLVPLAALPASLGTEFVDSGVFRNVSYTYAVSASNPAGPGPFSPAAEVHLAPPTAPDVSLSPQEFRVIPERPQAGEKVSVDGVVRNLGNVTVNSCRVRFYEGPVSLSGFRAEILNLTLPGRGSVEVNASWTFAGGTVITVEVDQVIPPESERANQRVVIGVGEPPAAFPLGPVLVAICVPAVVLGALAAIGWRIRRRFSHLPSPPRRSDRGPSRTKVK